MQDFEELKKAKQRCVDELVEALPRYRERLDEIDHRLVEYIEDALSNNASHANIYELMGIRKEFRLMDSYKMDVARVHRTLRAIEGVWQGGRHQKGGLKFSTPRGSQHVRLMPFQVWMLFEIYAFKVDVDMERTYHDGDMLLPSEKVRDGRVWDTRRLTQEAHWFLTRKSGKTELGGAVDFTEVCFLGDINGQALICTNSSEQSQIAYKAIREFAMQIDPTCSNRMGGRYFRMTRAGLNWQPGHRMKGEIKCMAAGKTSKDGLYASVVHADEHGQAGYVNAHSDMQAAVDTCWGSTGPRREKLLLHTTTAGRVKDGPYKTKIEQVEELLLRELDYPLGSHIRTSEDHWCAFLLRLDPWEVTDDLTRLDDTELFKKVNRSIGTTVQPTYYRERLHEAATGTEDTKQEVLTKDFNMWQTDKVEPWRVTADKVRQLQVPLRIGDCHWSQGWRVFVGMDFSSGDDLFGISYFAVNYAAGLEMKDRFFADCEAWVIESDLKKSPNRKLYEQWIGEGWLKVCPGDVFDSNEAINDVIRKAYPFSNPDGTPDYRQPVLDYRMFGYDPAQSRDPINQLKAWLQSLFMAQGAGGQDIVQRIRQMVIPVSQSFMTMNPVIQQMETYVLTPWMRFSMSPLWPWQASNAMTIASRDDTLKKIVKSKAANKVDNLHALLDAIYCYELSEGNIQSE